MSSVEHSIVKSMLSLSIISEVLILLLVSFPKAECANALKERVLLRASHSSEIVLSVLGARRLRSTLAAVAVLFAQAID